MSDTKLYVDGADSTGVVTNGGNMVATSANSDLILGKVGTSYFHGLLDDDASYSAELNASAISEIYGGGSGDFNKIRIVSTGSTDIVANQSGSFSFAPALPITKTITVSKQDQTITFNRYPESYLSQGTFVLNANASSGLTVSYVISDSSIAEVSGNVVTLKAGGTTSITASQAGNSTYDAAT